MSRLSHLAAVTAVFALVVAACGSSTGTATTVGATTVTTAAPAATTVTTAAPAATTTTTQPTTTTTLPFIRTGTYAVPDEVAPGTYRVWGNAATRLDENMELLGHYVVLCCGYDLMIVQPTDAFVSVGDWIITVDDFGPVDPIAEGFISGVYLVGYDLEPGRYEVLRGDHPEDPYWARLDDEMEIIDSGTDFGTLEVIIEDGDFAFQYKGVLRLIP